MAKDIIYVGKKLKKTDNVNENSSREWRGLGDVVRVASDLEAAKLLEHPDVWHDVTAWNDDRRNALIKGIQEARRKEEREQRKGQPITVGAATDDELAAELARRRGKPELNLSPSTPLDQRSRTPIPGSQGNETDPKERPDNTEDLAAEIAGVLALLTEGSSDFDGEGNPHVERVVEKLGYSVSYDEVMLVWKELKG